MIASGVKPVSSAAEIGALNDRLSGEDDFGTRSRILRTC